MPRSRLPLEHEVAGLNDGSPAHGPESFEHLKQSSAKYVREYPDAKLEPPEFFAYHPTIEAGNVTGSTARAIAWRWRGG